MFASRAFSTWLHADCGGGGPSLQIGTRGPVACDESRYNDAGKNANVVIFRDEDWPYPDGIDTFGYTFVRFNTRTGEIYDADVEINAERFELATHGGDEGADLQSILTHEVGHFLGLAHSTAPDATMQAVYVQGTADWRTLAQDDIDGICAIYPPDRSAEPCTFVPHGGFASECALGVLKGGCGMAPPNEPGRKAGALVACALAFIGLRRKARRRQNQTW